MNEHEFTKLLGGIDPALVARAEKSVPLRKKPSFPRALTAALAATLALLLCLSLAIVPFIPTTYDLDYKEAAPVEEQLSEKQNVWIWYLDQNGSVKREYARMPASADNVFLTWKHLNTIDDEVQLLDYSVTTNPMASTTVEPNTLWEYLQQMLDKDTEQTIVTATLSAGITSYENYDALIESLTQTIADYAGVDVGQVRILIDGEQVVIVGSLQFYHSLQGSDPIYVSAGQELKITVGMTNISSQDIEFTGSWMAFAPSAILTMGDTAVFVHEDFPMTEEYQKYVLAPGQSREITYIFRIPENALSGAYDLAVAFGNQSFTFEKAVNVIEITTPAIGANLSAYQAFLAKYGLNTTDPAAFKSAVQALSYNGVGLFEIMNEADVYWLPCHIGEMYGSEQFKYTYSEFSPDGKNKSQTITFEATVLPDGMSLPFGISTEQGLVDALIKMNMSEERAKQVLEEKRTILLADSVLSSHFNVTVSFESAYTEIAYKSGHYSVIIRFDENGEAFKLLQICAKYAPVAPGTQVVFTSFMYAEYEYELSVQQCEEILQILERAEKIPDVADLICDSSGVFNGIPFSYDSDSGVLIMDSMTYVLTEQDRVELNAMVVGSIEFDYPGNPTNFLCRLTDEHFDTVWQILKRYDWQSGTLELACEYQVMINGKKFGYSASEGIFCNNEIYLRLSEQDRITVNTILESYEITVQE